MCISDVNCVCVSDVVHGADAGPVRLPRAGHAHVRVHEGGDGGQRDTAHRPDEGLHSARLTYILSITTTCMCKRPVVRFVEILQQGGPNTLYYISVNISYIGTALTST